MSWINIKDCRFRKPLPNTLKDRFGAKGTTDMREIKQQRRCMESDFTLTKHIIPTELCWAEKSTSDSAQSIDTQVQDKTLKLDGTEFWIWRETSCDIELDTTASNILNVTDIITDVPDDPEVHWRAVPSLREIWTEERKRMADLLPPKDNFLSGDSLSQQSDHAYKIKTENLPFTLSVKKGADRPGSLLALVGSRKLYEPSPGLEGEFKRALTDIIIKHSKNLEGIDDIINDEKERHRANKFSRRTKSLTSPHLGKDELSDLQTLIEQFTQGKCIPSAEFIDCEAASNRNCQQQNNNFFTPVVCNLSQTFKTTRKLSQEEFMKVDDNLMFFQKIDAEQLFSDTIDPWTLTPYEDEVNDDYWTEEENMREEEFEQCLTMLATQHQGTASETFIIQEAEDMNRNTNNDQAQIIHRDDSKSAVSREIINDRSISVTEKNLIGTKARPVTNYLGKSFETCRKREVANYEGFATGKNGTRNDRCGINNVDSIQHSAKVDRDSSSLQHLSNGVGGWWYLKKALPVRGHFFPAETPQGFVWLPMCRHPQTSVPWLGYGNTESVCSQLIELSKYCILRGGHFEPMQKPPSSYSIYRWMNKKRYFVPSEESAKQKMRLIRKSEDKHGATCFQNASDFVKIPSDGNEFVEIVSPIDNKIIYHVPRSYTCKPATIESSGGAIKDNAIHSSIGTTQSTHTVVSQLNASVDTSRDNSRSKITDPLQGIGQQGGNILVYEGAIKASMISPSKSLCNNSHKRKITLMSIEVHVQCRIGKAGVNDSRDISMQADPSKDPIFAVCYGYAIDPGGGEKIQIIERGCIFVPTQNEMQSHNEVSNGDSSHPSILNLIGKTLGCSKIMKNEVVYDERQLLLRLASIVRWKDPDVLTSWDTQGGGIGYLIQRGLFLNNSSNHDASGSDIDMVRLLGRTPRSGKNKIVDHAPSTLINKDEVIEQKKTDCSRKWEGSILGAEWDERVGAGAGPSSIIGRLVLNCWRIISEEVKHPNISYQQAMIWTILKKRLPFHDDLLLTNWYGSSKGVNRWRVLKYRLCQAIGNILLLDALDVVGRAGEAARLSGVELSQSFPGIRGSQYKVEGVLLRALQSIKSDERGEKRGEQSSRSVADSFSDNTSSQNGSPWKLRRNVTTGQERKGMLRDKQTGYFFFSPSKSDCSTQEALECQALTLEPKSGFHFDPIVVCDFTALYPSLIIAYNLCYSTLAGKLEYHSTRKEMGHQGQTTGTVGPFRYPEAQTAYVLKQHMKSLENRTSKSDRAYCMPTGAIFMSEQVVKGVLPSILDELLSTRAMLKKAMQRYKTLEKPPAAVLRQLEARQLALKYVANVIYGYTSATFSGRCAMPILADTIVDCGRRTLTRAITLANEWGKEINGPWAGAEVIYGKKLKFCSSIHLRLKIADGVYVVRGHGFDLC